MCSFTAMILAVYSVTSYIIGRLVLMTKRDSLLASAKLLLVATLASGIWASLASAAPSPSRPPDESCIWRPFAALGLRLLVQDCTDKEAHYVFSTHGDWIEQHRPFNDRIFGSHQIIRVLRKPAGMPIQQAIMKFAGPTLPPKGRGHCMVTTLQDPPFTDGQKLLLTLMPTGAYRAKILAELQQEPRDYGCGPYGASQGVTYFEYHPDESRTRFLFVVYGDDEPLFDERSILIEPAGS